MQAPAVNRPADAEEGQGTDRYGEREADDDSLNKWAEFHGGHLTYEV
jgi:hypothetical protein